jgi:hypothetical protein
MESLDLHVPSCQTFKNCEFVISCQHNVTQKEKDIGKY